MSFWVQFHDLKNQLIFSVREGARRSFVSGWLLGGCPAACLRFRLRLRFRLIRLRLRLRLRLPVCFRLRLRTQTHKHAQTPPAG